jgi:hypothetical protein
MGFEALDIDDSEQLGFAKERFATVIEQGVGVICPCCSRPSKLYPRHLAARTLRYIIVLARESVSASADGGWVQVNNIMPNYGIKTGGEYGVYYRLWGFGEQKPLADSESGKKKHGGYWRITRRGMNFLLGRLAVPKTIWEFDGVPMKLSNETLFVGQVILDNKGFNYAELLNSLPTDDQAVNWEGPLP